MIVLVLTTGKMLMAQDNTETSTPEKVKKDWSKVVLKNRAADHFMFQFGIDNWSGAPDSVNIKGLSRSYNIYFMFDFVFKTDPRWSVGLGAGVGSSNIYFDKTNVDVKSRATALPFKDVSNEDHFKRSKLNLTHLEAPVELRFSTNPENMDKSWKLAIGAKVGTLMGAHTKYKNLQNKDGQAINPYTMKESSKNFFNGTKLAGSFRAGYGNISLFGQYQITTVLKEGAGAEMRPYSIGITLSGL